MIESPTVRRAILAGLVLVTVACLGVIAFVVGTRGAGDGLGDRLDSLKDGKVPGTSVAAEREQVLSVARSFATRFNTYDPSMLDDDGHLPEYASVSELMTPKFAGVFEEAVKIPEQTVARGAASEGIVYAVGVAAQDDDSASVLVAGTIELSYPIPETEGGDQPTDQPTDDDGRLSTGPQRFRYEVALVKIDGVWLVDDFDDVDDGRPPFSQPSVPEESPSGDPTEIPTEVPTEVPSDAPSGPASTEPSTTPSESQG